MFIFQHVYFWGRLTDLYVYILARVFLGESNGSLCFIFQHMYFRGD